MIGRVRGYGSFLCRSTYFSVKGYAVARVKYAREFQETLDDLERSQWCTEGDFRLLQQRGLQRLIAHAYATVPYYRKLFEAQKLVPEDIRTLEDLPKIPVLTKDLVRAHADELVSTAVNRRLLAPGWTTGSTGTPINALRTRQSIIFENAMIWRQRRWAGVHWKAKKVAVWGTIWNNTVIPSRLSSPPYWRHNLADNQLLFSYFHLSESTLPSIVRRLREFAPAYIEGFPSTMLVIAQYLEKTGQTLPVQALFTSSEKLYEVHRKLLEERFETRVFDLYGQAERVVAATECEEHTGLHINPEAGIAEILHGGEPVAPGHSGEIVGTGLNNYAMPLIRFCTGDVGRLSPESCPCGRKMPLLVSVEGRMADTILTADGRSIPGNGLMSALHGVRNVLRTQVVQEDIHRIVVKIVPEVPEESIDRDAVCRHLRTCVGEDMIIDVERVAAIEPGKRGKFQWVVSKVAGAVPVPANSAAPLFPQSPE